MVGITFYRSLFEAIERSTNLDQSEINSVIDRIMFDIQPDLINEITSLSDDEVTDYALNNVLIEVFKFEDYDNEFDCEDYVDAIFEDYNQQVKYKSFLYDIEDGFIMLNFERKN